MKEKRKNEKAARMKQYRLFNAKSCLYKCITGTICKDILLITFLNEPGLIFAHD